jgi:hypothetical protein
MCKIEAASPLPSFWAGVYFTFTKCPVRKDYFDVALGALRNLRSGGFMLISEGLIRGFRAFREAHRNAEFD